MKFLCGRTIIWTKSIRIYCDGGAPKFTFLPKYRPLSFYKYWGLKGFAIYLWGREFNFSFGVDKMGLYDEYMVEHSGNKHGRGKG